MVYKILCLICCVCFLEARLVFIHIPKTGGTTLRLLLEMQVDQDEIYPYKNHLQAKSPMRGELVSGISPIGFVKGRILNSMQRSP
jgi:hypothetical protein